MKGQKLRGSLPTASRRGERARDSEIVTASERAFWRKRGRVRAGVAQVAGTELLHGVKAWDDPEV